MIARIVLITAVLALGGLAIDGTPAAEGIQVPAVLQPAAADTCEGWPYPIPKLLDDCPHGPTP